MNILFFALLLSLSAHSRLITKSESKSVLNNLEINVYVKADGSYSVQKTYDFEVINAHEQKLSDFPVTFNPSVSKIKFLEGFVQTGEVKTAVDPAKISTVALNADLGFDPLTQWTIKIPSQEKGSKVHLKYQIDFDKPFVPGFYAQTFNFLKEDPYIESATILVISEIPLEYKMRDPYQSLKVDHLKKKFHEFRVTLKKPLVQGIKEEDQNVVAPENSTAISVGTFSDWDSIKRVYRSLFDIVLNSTPTPEMNSLIIEAKKKSELKDQLKLIADHFHDQFSYVGAMRTIQGRPALRMFKDLYATKMADDKEMAALMVVVLRSLKRNADVVLSSLAPRYLFQGLPDLHLFNRVLVKVEEAGETYWIDPTEKPFYELNHAFHFSGRSSLGFNEDDAVESVPFENPEVSQVVIQNKIKLNENGLSVIENERQYFGAAAFELFKVTRLKDLTEIFEQDLGKKEKALDFKLEDFDQNFKSFHPWNLKASYKMQGLVEPTNLSQHYRPLLQNGHKWLGELVLGEPKEITQTTTYYMNVDPSTRLKCSIKSDWIDVERKSIIYKTHFVIYDAISFKKAILSPDELASKSFLNLQFHLRECLNSEKIARKK